MKTILIQLIAGMLSVSFSLPADLSAASVKNLSILPASVSRVFGGVAIVGESRVDFEIGSKGRILVKVDAGDYRETKSGETISLTMGQKAIFAGLSAFGGSCKVFLLPQSGRAPLLVAVWESNISRFRAADNAAEVYTINSESSLLEPVNDLEKEKILIDLGLVKPRVPMVPPEGAFSTEDFEKLVSAWIGSYSQAEDGVRLVLGRAATGFYKGKPQKGGANSKRASPGHVVELKYGETMTLYEYHTSLRISCVGGEKPRLIAAGYSAPVGTDMKVTVAAVELNAENLKPLSREDILKLLKSKATMR